MQQLNSSPAIGLSCGASSGASLAGLIKSLEEGGEAQSAATNAPVYLLTSQTRWHGCKRRYDAGGSRGLER